MCSRKMSLEKKKKEHQHVFLATVDQNQLKVTAIKGKNDYRCLF